MSEHIFTLETESIKRTFLTMLKLSFLGQVVSVLALYSDDPSSNPAEAILIVKFVLEKNENKPKRGWGWPI